jgi:hypothetical protein
MERDLPTGRAENDLEITSHKHAQEFVIRTLSGPTPFVYRYAFSRSDGGTLVEARRRVELPGVAVLAGPLARRAVKRRGRQLRHAEARSRDTLFSRLKRRWRWAATRPGAISPYAHHAHSAGCVRVRAARIGASALRVTSECSRGARALRTSATVASLGNKTLGYQRF